MTNDTTQASDAPASRPVLFDEEKATHQQLLAQLFLLREPVQQALAELGDLDTQIDRVLEGFEVGDALPDADAWVARVGRLTDRVIGAMRRAEQLPEAMHIARQDRASL